MYSQVTYHPQLKSEAFLEPAGRGKPAQEDGATKPVPLSLADKKAGTEHPI